MFFYLRPAFISAAPSTKLSINWRIRINLSSSFLKTNKKTPPHLAFKEGRAVEPQVNKICVQTQNFRFREANVGK